MGVGFGGAGWDGDEGNVEGLAGGLPGALELAAVVDLDAADGVGPGVEQFVEERFGVAARGAGREARVDESAGGVDGGEVHAGASGVAALVQRVDLDVFARVVWAVVRGFAAGVHADGGSLSHVVVVCVSFGGGNDAAA